MPCDHMMYTFTQKRWELSHRFCLGLLCLLINSYWTTPFRYNSSGTLVRMLKYFYDSNGEIQFLLSKANNFRNASAYNLYTYVRDGLGNITGLIRVKSQSGSSTVQDKTLVAEYTYDSYGQIISATRPSGVTDDIYQINPIRYKGYYFDADTGWYNLKTRYYDPVIARFINADDVSLIAESPEGFTDKNLYSYCDNNPISRSDDDGDFWHVVIGAVFAYSGAAEPQFRRFGNRLSGTGNRCCRALLT